MSPLRIDRVASYATFGLLGCVLFIGLKAAMAARGVLPDYDGISYTDAALRVYLGLAGTLENVSTIGSTGAVVWVGLPFTNTLDVLLLALLYDVLDYHVGTWLIHSAYIVLFVLLARRILSPGATLLLFACAVANAYFLHQYVNLVSELKVGLLLALFVVYLFHEDVASHRAALFWITVLLIFARTINLLFIGPLVVIQIALRWRRQRAEAMAALKAVGLAVVVLSPMIAYHGYYMVDYMGRMGYSDVTQNWRDMTGVYDKPGLLRAYLTGMRDYHRALSVLFALALAAGVALVVRRHGAAPRLLRDALLAFAVVFAVLMQAQTNNIMVVYWVFILAALCFTLLARAVLPERFLVALGVGMAAVALWQTGANFVRHNQELARARPLTQLARSLAERIAPFDKPVVFANFRGVGPLDQNGFELVLGRTIGWPAVNILSYNTPMADYVKAIDESSVVLVANRNFMWPDFVGVNHKTGEIAKYMAGNAAGMGFLRDQRLLFDSDPSRYVDVYVRPSAEVKLKYAWFNDKWLDAETPVILKAPSAMLRGYEMELEVMVPGVSDPSFTFPLTATLVGEDGERLRSAVIRGAGTAKLSFALDGLAPGAYRLQFDKTFAPAGDPRRLAAMFVGSRIRYVGAR